MRKLIIPFLLILFCLSNIAAQELTPEQMEEYIKLAQPGEPHEMLAKYIGDWELTYTSNMGGGEQTVGPVKAEIRSILGGRFLEWTSEGEFNGQPMETKTIMGYDNRLNVYVLYGFDTMGTYGITPTGHFDEETNTIVYKGENYEPAVKDYMDYKILFKMIDDDNYVLEILFDFPEFGETTIMTVVGKRV